MVWDVRADRVDLGEAGVVRREYIRHPGAVGILAVDEQDRAAVIDQYRHPVGMVLWEVPAGLLDVAGEPPLLAAQRELGEEADLVAAELARAGRLDALARRHAREAFRCFLARGLSAGARGRAARSGTARSWTCTVRWVALDELRGRHPGRPAAQPEPRRRRPRRRARRGRRAGTPCGQRGLPRGPSDPALPLSRIRQEQARSRGAAAPVHGT